jgi:hypothetical protein
VCRVATAPNDAWKKAEKEIIAREKEACSAQIKREHSPQKIQQLILTKLTFKGRPSFSSLYAPVYLITYLHKGKRSSLLPLLVAMRVRACVCDCVAKPSMVVAARGSGMRTPRMDRRGGATGSGPTAWAT